MSAQEYPVTVAVRRPDGSVEQVRVGVAIRTGEGFSLKLGELTIGGTPVAAAAPQSWGGGGYGGGAAYGGSAPAAAGGLPTTLPNYGRSRGAPIYGASLQDLEYYANGARRSLADPSKARWHEKERLLLAAIEAEIARQQGGGGTADSGPPDDDIPPPTDDDIPF